MSLKNLLQGAVLMSALAATSLMAAPRDLTVSYTHLTLPTN